jgi:hypothetical protein
MKALRLFEDWVTESLEGRLGALLGGHMQPVDIAKRIALSMDDHRTQAGERTYVPNVYRVYLGPVAYAEIATFAGAVESELGQFVTRRAAEYRYSLAGAPGVRLLVDADLGGDRMRVDSAIADARSGSEMDRTRAIAAPDVAAHVNAAMAVVADGRPPMTLVGDEVTLGRALDNAVIVDHASVSRHHARLLRRGAFWLMEDLGSSHGSYVNGQRVTSSLLRPGDELRLGAAILRMVAA